MWIPVITILWALGESATWVNFPMVNFPFSSKEIFWKSIATKIGRKVIDYDYEQSENDQIKQKLNALDLKNE